MGYDYELNEHNMEAMASAGVKILEASDPQKMALISRILDVSGDKEETIGNLLGLLIYHLCESGFEDPNETSLIVAATLATTVHQYQKHADRRVN